MYDFLRRQFNLITALPCSGCGASVLGSSEPLCAACWGALYLYAEPKPIRLAFTGQGWSWLPYGTPEVQRVMGAIKFRGEAQLAVALGVAMASALRPPDVDALMPIPLSLIRQHQRGYNQAERLAFGLQRQWNIPLATDSLYRKGWRSPKQSARSADQRNRIYGAYDIRPRSQWKGARLALIDDTLTTGSTLNAAAEVLIKKAKVAEVIPLTLAYASRRAT